MDISGILRGYEIHIKLYEILKDEYESLIRHGDIKAQSYEDPATSGHAIKKPVEEYVQKIEALRNMMNELDRYIAPVNALVSDLSEGKVDGVYDDSLMLEILQSHYCENRTLKQTAKGLRISVKKAIEYKKRLVRKTREYANSGVSKS